MREGGWENFDEAVSRVDFPGGFEFRFSLSISCLLWLLAAVLDVFGQYVNESFLSYASLFFALWYLFVFIRTNKTDKNIGLKTEMRSNYVPPDIFTFSLRISNTKW